MASTIRVKILGDASDLKKAAQQAEDIAGSLEKSFGGLGTKLTAAFAGIGAANVVKGAIDAAADIGEQYSKLTVLVGDSAKELDDWSKTTAKSIGVGRQEALKGLGTFANLFQVMGKGEKETAAMSKRFLELATDMASFNNADPAQVIEALGAALRGESEPIRAFGVMLDDATLKQQALKLGLISTTKEALSPAIKMQAAYYEILAQTGKQQGDVARTADSLSNQTRFLSAEFKDLQIQLGQQLLPIAAEVVGAMRNGLIPAIQNVMPVIGGMAEAAFNAGKALGGLISPFAEGGIQAAVFAGGALAAYNALVKIKEVGDQAKLTMLDFAKQLTTPLGVAGLGATLISGALAFAFVEHQKEAAEAKKRQESLNQAMKEGNDPVLKLVERFEEYVKTLDKVEGKTEDAEDAVRDYGSAWLFTQIKADDAGETFNRLGLDIEQATRAVAGTEDDWMTYLKVIENADYATKEVSFSQRVTLVESLRKSREAMEGSREEMGKRFRDALIEVANRTGEVTQAQLDQALAASKGETELAKWYEVGQRYAHLVPEIVEKTDDLAEATDKNTEATERAKLSDEDLKKIKDELTKAIDAQIDATLAAANADLAHQRQQRSLAEASQALTQKQADLNAATRDYGPNSKEAQTAAYELEESLSNLKGEALQTAESAVQLARKQAEAAGTTLSARDANMLMIDELGKLRDATGNPALRDYIDALILKFQGAEEAAFRAAMQMAAFTREAAFAAGAQEMPGMGIITSADRLAGRASGGPVKAGTSYVVGEQGPEILTMGRQSGFVTPNDRIGGTAAAVYNITVNGMVAADLDAAARAIREAIRRAERAQR